MWRWVTSWQRAVCGYHTAEGCCWRCLIGGDGKPETNKKKHKPGVLPPLPRGAVRYPIGYELELGAGDRGRAGAIQVLRLGIRLSAPFGDVYPERGDGGVCGDGCFQALRGPRICAPSSGCSGV